MFVDMTILTALILAAQASAPAPALRPITEYLMAESDEIALAISAGPPAVGSGATVFVLRRDGYAQVRTGTSGFTCVVQRGWSSPLSGPGGADFFDPRLKAPICYNPSASRTIFQEYLRRTELVLSGKSREEVRRLIFEEIGSGKLRPPIVPAMAYMLSAGQWIGARVEHWHPHVMWYLPFADATTVGGPHELESGLPLAFDFMGSPFATFVMQAKDFVPVRSSR